MTLTGNELLAFQAITGFVEAANEQFRVSQKSLSLYARLIEKTTFKHTDVIYGGWFGLGTRAARL